MRAVLTRVSSASVTIDGTVRGSIGRGFLILLGIGPNDTPAICKKLAEKCLSLRIFTDDQDKMNLGLSDVGGQVLVISQFTLYGDCKKGRRPALSMPLRRMWPFPFMSSFWMNAALWATSPSTASLAPTWRWLPLTTAR